MILSPLIHQQLAPEKPLLCKLCKAHVDSKFQQQMGRDGNLHTDRVHETWSLSISQILLVRIEYVDGRLIEPEILTETTFCELCLYVNLSYEPYAVEILSPHEICITYR